MNANNWQLSYDTVSHGVRAYGEESLLTLGNGYLGWRGAPIMTSYSDDHYPGLYVAGVFNQTSTPVAGRDVINEDMVNLPNPQLLKLVVDGEPVVFDPQHGNQYSILIAVFYQRAIQYQLLKGIDIKNSESSQSI